MNAELVAYMNNILIIRDEFLAISHIKDSEAMNIWARWIITHRGLCRQTNLCLPDDDAYDSQLQIELESKGCSSQDAAYTFRWLLEQTGKANKNYRPIAEAETGGLHGTVPVTVTRNFGQVTLCCDTIKQVLPISVYIKMSNFYRKDHLASHKDNYIWLCSALYSILDGKGLQWAVPPRAMQLFQRMGCHTEIFASPLNTYNRNYYSLYEFDRAFSSKGNFFSAPDSDFAQGTFQVNPPFINPVFCKTTERIFRLLEIAESSGKKLTFIYVMPEWEDFETYNMVIESRFFINKILLRAKRHYYYQYSTKDYIKARFGSHIVFLSTDIGMDHPPVEDIREAFMPERY